jgi:hypothetical protein
MAKKKKTERIWSYKRAPDGWEVCLDGKSKGVVVRNGSDDCPWSWRSSGKSGGPHQTRNEAAAALLQAYKQK